MRARWGQGGGVPLLLFALVQQSAIVNCSGTAVSHSGCGQQRQRTRPPQCPLLRLASALACLPGSTGTAMAGCGTAALVCSTASSNCTSTITDHHTSAAARYSSAAVRCSSATVSQCSLQGHCTCQPATAVACSATGALWAVYKGVRGLTARAR